jgi:hypothetical protein
MTERDTLIESLARHRGFLLFTAEGLTEDQARTASTVSELTIASLLKHVADTEEGWMEFALHGSGEQGPGAGAESGEEWSVEAWEQGEWKDERFTLTDEHTLEHLRGRIGQVAARTEGILRTADLDLEHALPAAPWYEPGAVWSVRRVALHVLAEISQHAGHADIIREALDGQRTMG